MLVSLTVPVSSLFWYLKLPGDKESSNKIDTPMVDVEDKKLIFL
jgi:hypothetical protein